MAKSKNIKKERICEYVAASKHGEFMAMNECITGFTSTHKVHKSKKAYDRKRVNKINF